MSTELERLEYYIETKVKELEDKFKYRNKINEDIRQLMIDIDNSKKHIHK